MVCFCEAGSRGWSGVLHGVEVTETIWCGNGSPLLSTVSGARKYTQKHKHHCIGGGVGYAYILLYTRQAPFLFGSRTIHLIHVVGATA